ncbi:aminotransferase, classes I and II superfamily [Fragilariopsis cylindrus CCMP1102]|uniref:Aminotransferase, classes I and II superfamily n=1 Tax=Fragilariopsis cylindrus CCMP1102 TaxID=635003 RepID=A0A1E7FAP2_9STRA|nr:aminotransferase, classes I and II superfamily [Fragilariopsis cylindrus CCMP1102]|eukprot:OEU15228.1 aminotransferase, classes I and II superfamily [Fragilariopsis cylindrus CCMP1102]
MVTTPSQKSARARRSSVMEAHSVFDVYHKHQEISATFEELSVEMEAEDAKDDADAKSKSHEIFEKGRKSSPSFPQFHKVMKTGVIYATTRAKSNGFSPETEHEWANMGQGAPETGTLPGAPSRNFSMTIPEAELEYAPVTGLQELRVKVADYYNHLYRQGKSSQYTPDNVCVVPGGRAGLTRIMAVLGNVNIGYFTPDYTAYEQCLGLFLRISPSPLLHRDVNDALMDPKEFEFQVKGAGLGSVLLSNPANPTGQSIEGEKLRQYVDISRRNQSAIIMDEFYSHYYYDGEAVDPADGGVDDNSNWPKTVSSASYIDDVNEDPILIVNGLTKNWRCPGFRICWIVAPKAIVSMLGSAGSYLDGGANAPLQRLALPLMELDFIRRDTWALQRHFVVKRDFLLKELDKLGIIVQWKPTATFYIWADISRLPPPLNDSLVFLEECAKHKIICVPGVFFDINPRGLKTLLKSTCIANVRFSYGPPMRNLTLGMERLATLIAEWELSPETPLEYVEENME